jgi:DNA-directed RNA polymerase specialized sigma24 family protein
MASRKHSKRAASANLRPPSQSAARAARSGMRQQDHDQTQLHRTEPPRKTVRKPAAEQVSATLPAAEQRDALRTLVERNYATLREIARRRLRNSPLAKTMSPTSLVAESVVRLMKQRALPTSAPHLSGLATILMAQALSDRAKVRRAGKRNSGARMLPLHPELPSDRRLGRSGDDADAVARTAGRQAELVQQMEALGREHPRRMEVVTLHLVLGIALSVVARMLQISERTAFRELASGRAALAAALGMHAEQHVAPTRRPTRGGPRHAR